MDNVKNYIAEALLSLGHKNYRLYGEPKTEEEFNASFVKLIGADNTESTDPNDFGITWAEVSAEADRLKAAYDAAEYQRNRAAAYPSIQEQLDMQYWDSVNGTTTWADAIAAVKAAHPKGA